MNEEKNFVPMSSRTPEERKAIQRKGGQKSVEARKRKKELRYCLERLLETKMNDECGDKVTGAEALSTSIFRKALEGDTKAWELVRDTVGQKPADRIEQVNANVVIDLSDLAEDEEESDDE